MGDKVKLKIGHLNITDHLILGISKDRFDKKQDEFKYLDLETVPLVGWPEVVNKLEGDDLDGAFILAPSAMDLYKSGLPIRLVLLGHKTGSIFIKRSGAGIEDIQGFKGQTIIIPFQLSVHHMLIHQLLSEGGLTPGKDVMFETLAPIQMPEALEYGEEDNLGGFIVAEPFGSISLKAGHGEIFSLSKDLWPKHPCCVFVVKENVINNSPDALQELVNSLVKSGDIATNNMDDAAAIGAGFLKQDKELIKGILSDPPDRIMTNELLPEIGDFDKMQNYMTEKMGVLKGKIDLDKFIDTRFAKEAV
ncbi:MAG: ABC transporter substrate-binding protein [bacterium]|nr:ABC transporter substrate-binding protein [bacterium]